MRVRIIYDGDCPFCTRYLRLYRLREALGNVDLIDARQSPGLVRTMHERGLDLDQGLVLDLDGQLFHGAEAMHRLALMGTRSGWFNRFNFWLFRHGLLASLVYPLLRGGRRATLWLLGRTPISADSP